jgi:hypothetical protein
MKSNTILEVLSAVIVIIMGSCKTQNKNLIVFSPGKFKENNISLSLICDDVNYIPLDNQFALGLINNLSFSNNSIYLSALNTGVMVFGDKGEFLRKIGAIGRGPGEYRFSTDFVVDDKTENVFICDQDVVKIYSKRGRFLRSFSIHSYGDYVDGINLIDNKLFAFYNLGSYSSKSDWVVFDTSGKMITTHERTIPGFESNYGGGASTYKFNGRLHYWNSFVDTVYAIRQDLTIEPSFIFNAGKLRIPKAKVTLEELSKYIIIQNVLETRQYIDIRYFYCFPVNKYVHVLIDKTNSNAYSSLFKASGFYMAEYSGGIINDYDGGPDFLPERYFVREGCEYLVGIVYPYQIIALVKSDEFKDNVPKNPEKKKVLLSLTNNLKETDNPVLMIVRLKE